MELHLVKGFLPVVVDYNDDMEEWQGGYCMGPYVRIRTKYKDIDVGILNHELVHAKQWYSGFWSCFLIHPLRYKFDAGYRYDCELEAYRVQLDAYNTRFNPPNWCVNAIMEKYDLTVTREQVIADLAK
jgi:hypothetical protein